MSEFFENGLDNSTIGVSISTPLTIRSKWVAQLLALA